MDFISGERFKALADFTYAPKNKLHDDYDKLANTADWHNVKEVTVVYTHTMYVNSLFDIIRHLGRTFIVITHNSDCRIEEQGIVTADGKSNACLVEPYVIPDNVFRWYSSNVNVVHPKIAPIPIGLENKMWRTKVPKVEMMVEKCKQLKEHKNLLYINHSIGTNVKQRQEPYKRFEGENWATVVRGKNGDDFASYIDDIYNHKFMICPEGNGIDTHRTWECLYMSTIPILKRHINFRFYTDLPICFVNEWSEVTEAFLNSEYKRITDTIWNMDKLNSIYWRNMRYPGFQNQAVDVSAMDGFEIEEILNGALKKNKVMVQIGTNNGRDEFNTVVRKFKASKTILVEPDDRHNLAVANYYKGVDNVHLENVAITEGGEELVQLVTPAPLDLTQCYSLLPMDDWGDDFDTIEVPGISFNALCEKYGVTDVHYLQIDTEGYDVEILKAIDFEKINIDIIKFENWNFKESAFTRYGDKSKLYGLNGREAGRKLLTEKGYKLFNEQGPDTLAIKVG